MTLVVTANIAGQTLGEPVRLPDRRRCRFHDRRAPQAAGRRFIVSVHREGETFLRPMDGSVRLRKKWSGALVGPDDVVLLTVVPGRGGIASIGLAIASIALIAVAPYAATALATALGGVSATAVKASLVIGGVVLDYAAQGSSAAKNESRKKTASPGLNTAYPRPKWLASAYDILRSDQDCLFNTPENTTMPSAEIQQALLARGYGRGPSGADEDAGPRTIAAVAAFHCGEPQVFPFRHSKGLRVLTQQASSAPASPAFMARTARKPRTSGMCVRNRFTTRLAGTPAMLRGASPRSGMPHQLASFCSWRRLASKAWRSSARFTT